MRKAALSIIAAVALVGLLVGAYEAGFAAGDDADQIADLEQALERSESEREQALERFESEREDLSARIATLEGDLSDSQKRLRDVSGSEGTFERAVAGLGEIETVSEGKTIKLEEMSATLEGWETKDVVSDRYSSRRADGIFLVATVTLENRLNSSVTVDPEEAFTLVAGPRRFDVDFDAMNYGGGDRSWLNIGLDGIQPGTSITGTVVFDIARSSQEDLDEDGLVAVKQFSDAEFLAGRPKLPVAGLLLSD